MRIRASLVAIVAALAMSGCEQTGGQIGGGPSGPKSIEEVEMLRTDATNYERAGPVTVRFTNRTNTTIAFSQCRQQLQRRNGDGDWVGATSSLTENCRAEERMLRPGQSVTYSLEVARGTAGTYRVVSSLGQMAGISTVLAISNSFTVTRQD